MPQSRLMGVIRCLSISILLAAPSWAGSLALRQGHELPCASRGVVLDGVVACMATDKSIQAAPIEQLDRGKTEESMGPLTWYESRGAKLVKVPPPDIASKRPDPAVLSSLRQIQDRLNQHEDALEARKEAADAKKRKEAQEHEDRANAWRNLKPTSRFDDANRKDDSYTKVLVLIFSLD